MSQLFSSAGCWQWDHRKAFQDLKHQRLPTILYLSMYLIENFSKLFPWNFCNFFCEWRIFYKNFNHFSPSKKYSRSKDFEVTTFMVHVSAVSLSLCSGILEWNRWKELTHSKWGIIHGYMIYFAILFHLSFSNLFIAFSKTVLRITDVFSKTVSSTTKIA